MRWFRSESSCRCIVVGVFITVLCLCFTARAAAMSGFIDVNSYPVLTSVENDSVLTVNLGAKLAARFSYFSLNNYYQRAGSSRFLDVDRYYTEQNLRWQVAEDSPLDLTLQLNFRSGSNNDRQRLGFRWRVNDTQLFEGFFNQINLTYSINFHVVQFDNNDGDVWQMEHVFRLTVPELSERWYLSGFMDHTFNEQLPAGLPNNPIVAEAQLGFRLIDQLYLVTEYRRNEYRRGDVTNVAVGLEYNYRW